MSLKVISEILSMTVAHGAGDDSPPTSSSNTVTWPFVLHVHRALAAIHKNNIAAPNLWHPIDTYDRVALAHHTGRQGPERIGVGVKVS
uniref:Uncharacterized protein n=1 Tax=Oryza nivara TaxID=4536 RepID=A0A0E0HJE9_ORYNI